ncbi:MAG: hypothetical protein U9R79_10425, partial [Armatimonadota bacterium]|nr:hypothetical protein [Armatimonadota bacterium]
MDLQIRELAEYPGGGLLTSVEVYGGEVWVGCLHGEYPLYTVTEAAGFCGVELPMAGADRAGVQALVVWQGQLHAFGYLFTGLRLSRQREIAAAIWRYEEEYYGGGWQLLATTTQGVKEQTRWCQPVGLSDGIACGMWAGYTTGGGFSAVVRDLSLQQLDTTVQVRAQVALGDRLVRLIRDKRVHAYWRLESSGEGIGCVSIGPCMDHYSKAIYAWQMMAAWQGRVWLVGYHGRSRRQYLWSRALEGEPTVHALWDPRRFGYYQTLLTVRNRLLLFGDDRVWPHSVNADNAYMAVWEPPRFQLRRPLSWRVSRATVDGDRLLLLGRTGRIPFVNPGDEAFPTEESDLRQYVLVTYSRVALDEFAVEWSDGSGSNKPTVDLFAVEWSRVVPTEVAVDALAVEWSDGSGAHKPRLDLLTVHWSDGHALNQPTVDLLWVVWGKGGDHYCTVDSFAVQWSDGSGTNKPTVDLFGVHWSDGSGTNKPTVDQFAAQWTDRATGPLPQDVKLDLLQVQWNDDGDPVGTDEILWLRHTAERNLVGLRVVTAFSVADGGDLQCVVRCDKEDAPVDAWGTYQKFLANRTVLIDEPGA